ncbi:MAG: HAMP domain-containing protein, partial [Dehalococcoidia bacterium]
MPGVTILRLAIACLALFVVELIVIAAASTLSGDTIALAGFGSAAALVIALGALWLTLSPLHKLLDAARTIAGGDFTVRTDAGRASGVAELAEAFNHMAQSLGQIMEQASHERNRLKAALDSSADAVVAVDPDGRIAFANVAAEGLLQRDKEQLAGNPFAWVLADEGVVNAVRAAREDGRAESCSIERPNQRYLQAIATPIVGGGEWAALVVF